ncbi:hypothetical protein OnM2_018044 [Erysiphe neolycopersici]|uniref:MULE transposase domain-containing protein n=1 Tax=Erysiphe neolycopersici TaxID=212602 RepID=A0A420I478_9PEZI|nr:hypothetical protein OnM2_018044 [Erysiphe neolycopersici]
MFWGQRYGSQFSYHSSFLHPKGTHRTLEDNTYSTNRYKMPMMNILAVTGNNLNPSVGVCFMEEDTESYGRALQ